MLPPEPPGDILTPAVLAEAFPLAVRPSALEATEAMVGLVTLSYRSARFDVQVFDADILIPYRIHFRSDKVDQRGLTDRQFRIAQCLLTRSTDGFMRQRALGQVLRINQPWSIPFVIALIGEYAIEILNDIHAALPTIDQRLIGEFLRANPSYHHRIQARATSYWNAYYRADHRRADYVGFKILDALRLIGAVT